MTTLKGIEIRKLLQHALGEELESKKVLFIILGLLGDFDSFEQVQSILPIYNKLEQSRINLRVIGIGNKQSKDIFCSYTNLPSKDLIVVEDNTLHKNLLLNRGSQVTQNGYINLLLMCLGFNSPGTIKEVIRGYLGDQNASGIFNLDQKITKNKLVIKPELFNMIGNSQNLRPFELASLRLSNLFEVLSNWKLYMYNESYFTQRGGTFLIDEGDQILYSYKSKGLLGFSDNMSKPLDYLDKFLEPNSIYE